MRRTTRFVIFTLILSSTFSLMPQPITAQTGPEVVISPASIELDLDPGASTSFKLTIVNTSDVDRTFEVKLSSFNKGTEAGEPTLDDSISTPLHDWLELPSTSLQIAAQGHAEYTVNLSVPLNARPGSYRTVILFRDIQVQTDVNSSIIAAEFGPLVFVEVNGKVIEQAEILSFQPKQYVNESLPVAFSTLISNQGNIDFIPLGTINIRPIYALNNEGRNFNFNPTFSRTLADSQRPYEVQWVDQANWQIGYYEAEVVFAYGDSNKVLSAKTNFWIIPWKTILILILIAVAILIIFRARKSRKRPNHTPKPVKSL